MLIVWRQYYIIIWSTADEETDMNQNDTIANELKQKLQHEAFVTIKFTSVTLNIL